MADFTETNRAHWNKTAATYNSSNEKTVLELINEVQKRTEWIGVNWLNDSDSDSDDGSSGKGEQERSVRLLDYACGTGMISRALGPYISSATGIDLSENMVETYNMQASNQGLSPSEMHAVVGNLLDSSNPAPAHLEDPKFYEFDVAAVGLGFHHFENPVFAAMQLGKRLKKGGILFLVDFVTHEPHGGHHGHGNGHGHGHSLGNGEGHGHSHRQQQDKGNDTDGVLDVTKLSNKEKEVAATVKHFGFSEEEMRSYFKEAGVGSDFGYQVVERDVVFKMETRTMTRKVFFCKGTKD